ncbi:MAG: hypothetical protein Salg2KO_06350 [Salibacteraceae bacterium]
MNNMNYQRWNNILGWLVFAIAAVTYISTLEPTASFWDCGEYIATSYRLEVGHPPGAPTFLLVGRLFSMFAQPENVAYMVNLISALSSAFTILFLFWTISALALKIFRRSNGDGTTLSAGDQTAIFGSAIIGALAYTFSDTFWFSAEEGEVYALSSMMTAITFWAILKWEQKANEPKADRWIILIAYLIGLSIGIHLLNLLAIPAIAYVIYFKKYKPNLRGIVITGAVGVFALGGIQGFIIPGIVSMAAKFEFAFVNTFGAPFHSGSIIFIFLLLGAIVYGIFFTIQKNKPTWNTALLSLLVLIIGYSSFTLIMIRSNANTPIDENNPENLVNLLAYLNREQYGESPLAYGQQFNSPLDPQDQYLDGDPVYYPDERTGKYELADDRKSSKPNYHPDFKTFFPRMWSTKKNHVKAYKQWSDFKGRPTKYRDPSGRTQTINKPTFIENMRYFFNYQVGWMYFRYFMWNFSGRQNDHQGHGGFEDGNWLTGISFIDEAHVGNQKELPQFALNQKARNFFYALPFILGLLGMIFHFRKHKEYAWVVLLLFFFTGLAIVLYLNQYPFQPRERDYAYAGSFYAFAIWIGFGVLALYDAARNLDTKEFGQSVGYAIGGGILLAIMGAMFGGNTAFALLMLYMAVVGSALLAVMHVLGKVVTEGKLQAAVATALCFIAPVLMAKDGWDDHDRSGRYTARAIAQNYLDSCEPNAILFTNGDNDTFPLWYLQEVEGYRTDVRVVNLTLGSTDWFIDMIKRQAYDDGMPVKLSMEKDDYRQGTRDYLPIVERTKDERHVNIDKIVAFALDNKNTQPMMTGKRLSYIPTRNFRLPVDSATVMENKVIKPEYADRMVDAIEWSVKGSIILKSELLMLDILANNNWERPIYYANTMPRDSYFGLQNYMQHEGFTYRLVPYKVKSDGNQFGYFGEVEPDIMYQNMMEEFSFGNMQDPDIFLDENNMRFVTNLRLNFSRLADVLAKRGDTERSKAVLDKCVEITVNSNTPHDITLLQVVDTYFQIDEKELGFELAKKLGQYYIEHLAYYASLEPKYQAKTSRETGQAVAVIQQLQAMATQYQMEEMKEHFQPIFDEAQGYYTEIAGSLPQQQQQRPRQ